MYQGCGVDPGRTGGGFDGGDAHCHGPGRLDAGVSTAEPDRDDELHSAAEIPAATQSTPHYLRNATEDLVGDTESTVPCRWALERRRNAPPSAKTSRQIRQGRRHRRQRCRPPAIPSPSDGRAGASPPRSSALPLAAGRVGGRAGVSSTDEGAPTASRREPGAPPGAHYGRRGAEPRHHESGAPQPSAWLASPRRGIFARADRRAGRAERSRPVATRPPRRSVRPASKAAARSPRRPACPRQDAGRTRDAEYASAQAGAGTRHSAKVSPAGGAA